MVEQKRDGTSIPQIQLGASQLDIEERGEDGYKRRRGAREKGLKKLERRSVDKNKREKKNRKR